MTQSRRMLVLRAVVEDYIRSQEPVGSTSLTRDHDLGVSSATIRNDMAALEDEGYLIRRTLRPVVCPPKRAIDTLWTDLLPWCRSARRNAAASTVSCPDR